MIQFDTVPQENEYNVDQIERLASDAAARGAEIIMFHEGSVTDYVSDVEKYSEYVPDGPSCKRIERLAKNLGTYITFGISEKTPDKMYYITQVFMGPKGFIYKYRKTWLWTGSKDQGYRNEWARYDCGPGPQLFDIAGLKATCFICADGEAPRCIDRAKNLKPDIVFYPNNRQSYLGDKQKFAERAAYIGAPMLVTNRVGKSWVHTCAGGCSVIDQTGRFLARTEPNDGEKILVWDLAIAD